ncbi:MAG: hypothetical protein IPL78_17025 [Chloroflexi bacterium]|nr:hypothetical protein [Chloroflexota bacterium]
MRFNLSVPPVVKPETENVAHIAAALCRWGLRLPALLALDAGRPLTFLGAQCLYIAQPALNLFLPSTPVSQLAHLLETPEGVEMLIEQLETSE